MKGILCIVTLLAVGAACGGTSGPHGVPGPEAPAPGGTQREDPPPVNPPPGEPAPENPDPGDPAPGDPAAPAPAPDVSSGALRTAADRFVLERGEFGWEATIPYTYENPTGGPVFVITCNRPTPPALEKWDGFRWVPAWWPIVQRCLGPPLRIEAGARHDGELWLFAGYPGNNWHPKFERVVAHPEGTYRLVWEPRSSYEPRLPFGPLLPLEDRVSNPFELIEGD